MVEASCRYFQRGFTDSVTEDEKIAVIGVCTHPRLKRDNPDCEACVIPRLARYQMCPGITQKFDQAKQLLQDALKEAPSGGLYDEMRRLLGAVNRELGGQ